MRRGITKIFYVFITIFSLSAFSNLAFSQESMSKTIPQKEIDLIYTDFTRAIDINTAEYNGKTTKIPPEAEPENFRGMSWQDNLGILGLAEELKPSFPVTNNLRIYIRNLDEMKLWGVRVEKILYAFIDGKFSGVIVQTDGDLNWEALKKACFNKLGEAKMATSTPESYIWEGDHLIIDLFYHKFSEKGNLHIISINKESKGLKND